LLLLVKIGLLLLKLIENQLIEKFKEKEAFTREELLYFLRYFEPDLKEGTFGWRIYDLKNKNIIKPIRRGLYTISYKPTYKPELSTELKKFSKHISSRFQEVKHCIWATDWLNEFTQHQATKQIILIEIEKDLLESLYYELKDHFGYEIFFYPNEKVMDYYIAESDSPVIIKKIITRSPLGKQKLQRTNFYAPALEKILVDVFAEQKLFYHYQGRELIHIYKNAMQEYSINFTKLFSYARRRKREQEIKQFLTNHVYHIVKEYIE